MSEATHILGICKLCADYIDAHERFEPVTIGDGGVSTSCAGCNSRGAIPAYKVTGYLGDWNCSDCRTMTHCETHHKVEGLYPLAPSQ